VINEQIRDAMSEVGQLTEAADEGSTDRVLLHVVHGMLGSIHTLLYQVNSIRLAKLVNGKVD
jgi:hypothetical protein